MAMGQQLGQSLNAAMLERGLQTATPLTIPAIQHSAMLADALQQLQQTGGQNLRTPLALGSNLLAEALLGYANKKATSKLLEREQADRQSMLGGLASMAGVNGPAADASAPMPAPGPAAAAPAPAPVAQGPTPSPQAAALADALSPADRDAAVRMAWGESRGEGAPGQQAAVAVAMNRAHMAHQPLASVIAAPHQFAGYNPSALHLDPNSPQYQQIAHNIDPLLSGQTPDPTGGADHFFNPQLANPSWGQGPGQMIGHQKFMALGYGGQPPGGMPQGAQPADQGAIPAGAMAPPPPAAPPGQMPQGGPSPFAPNPAPSSPGAAPAPPGLTPGAPGPGGASSDVIRAMPAPITPQQIAAYHQMEQMAQGNSAFLPQLQQMAVALQKQRSTPEEMEITRPNDAGQVSIIGKSTGHVYGVRTPEGLIIAAGPKMRSDGQGGFQPLAGTGFTQVPGAPPGSMIQQNQATGEIKADAIPNAQQNGMVWNAQQGRYVPIEGLQYKDVPGPPNAYLQRGPNNEIHATPNPAYGSLPPGTSLQGGAPGPGGTPGKPTVQPIPGGAMTQQQVAQRGQDYNASDLHKNVQHALAAYEGLASSLGKVPAGGPMGMAAMDTFFKTINPPVGVRPATVQVFMEHQGVPREIQAHILNAFGQGFMTPQTVKEMTRIAWNYAHSLVSQDQAAAAANEQWATGIGHDPRELGQQTFQAPDLPDYAADAPPPPNQRHPGMTVWSRKGPVTWDGHGWVKQ